MRFAVYAWNSVSMRYEPACKYSFDSEFAKSVRQLFSCQDYLIIVPV